jgi:hypothetical protein
MDLNLSGAFVKPASEQAEAPVVKPDYMYPDDQAVYRELRRGTKVLGVPAASLSWGIDGNTLLPQLESGIDGEKQTAAILEEFVNQHKGAFAFHSLSWPESNGDTDHMLVYRNLVIIIDSKRWKSQRKYSVSANGEILRGTVHFDEGKVKIIPAMKTWKNKLPKNLKVLGVVCIAQEKVFVQRDRNWGAAGFKLVEAERLAEFLDATVRKYANEKPTPLSVLLTLGRLLVSEKPKVKLRLS